MSYRDDHDAALSRIEALERDLVEATERAREKTARDHTRIAMLEREIADLRRHASAERAPRPAPSPAAAATPLDPVTAGPLAGQGPPISRAVLGALLVLAVAIAMLGYYVLHRTNSDRPATCSIETEQSAVTVVGFIGTTEHELGIAPVTLSESEWRSYSRIELRHEGYDAREVPVPVAPCQPRTYRLYSR